MTAEQLRAAFDAGFAAASVEADVRAAWLRIRLAGDPHAVALHAVESVHKDLRACRVPTHARELLGVAAVRSTLLPLYDLRVLCGVDASTAPAWAMRFGHALFAFDGFDGLIDDITHLPVVDLSKVARGAGKET